MTWYCAHTINTIREIVPAPGPIVVYEDIYLIEAKDESAAMEKAAALAKQRIVHDPSLSIDGRPAERKYIGIRKLISVSNTDDQHFGKSSVLLDGAEVTYSRFEVKNEGILSDLVSGEEVNVRYVE